MHTFVQNSCGGIRSSCFIENYKYFVSAGDDGTMCVWDVYRRVLVKYVGYMIHFTIKWNNVIIT